MKWCLGATNDVSKEWVVTIESDPFIIGRGDDCNLKLTDQRISRHHSEIHMGGDLLWIRDLNSTNGTFVNDKQIEESELLDREIPSKSETTHLSLTCWILHRRCR